MKDIQISLKKLISGLENDLKSEASMNLNIAEKACAMIRKEYIRDLIWRLKDTQEDLVEIKGD